MVRGINEPMYGIRQTSHQPRNAEADRDAEVGLDPVPQ